jgi:hypothetical protein
VEVGQIPILLVEVEAVPHEELVRDGEADIAHGEVLDEAAVGTVQQRDCGQRARRTQRQRLAEVVERQPGVDDVLDDEDVAARDLAVQVLEQTNAGVSALVGAGGVAGELEEIEAVGDPERTREVGDEDAARLQRCDEQRLTPVVVPLDLAAELGDARLQLLAREVDLAEARAAAYDASSSRYRSARRSMSRL